MPRVTILTKSALRIRSCWSTDLAGMCNLVSRFPVPGKSDYRVRRERRWSTAGVALVPVCRLPRNVLLRWYNGGRTRLHGLAHHSPLRGPFENLRFRRTGYESE